MMKIIFYKLLNLFRWAMQDFKDVNFRNHCKKAAYINFSLFFLPITFSVNFIAEDFLFVMLENKVFAALALVVFVTILPAFFEIFKMIFFSESKTNINVKKMWLLSIFLHVIMILSIKKILTILNDNLNINNESN